MLALIDKGKTWVKLSGAYADTKIGPPTYADATAVAQAYAKHAPERCVWGSDWPHPGVPASEPKPDDAVLFDLLLVWAPDEKARHRILVENPAVLYDFPEKRLTRSRVRRPMTMPPPRPLVEGPSAWIGRNLRAREDEWIYRLSAGRNRRNRARNGGGARLSASTSPR